MTALVQQNFYSPHISGISFDLCQGTSRIRDSLLSTCKDAKVPSSTVSTQIIATLSTANNRSPRGTSPRKKSKNLSIDTSCEKKLDLEDNPNTITHINNNSVQIQPTILNTQAILSIEQPTKKPKKARPHKGNNKYKSELCRSWTESGTCKYKERCQYAHGVEELRPVTRHIKYKSELCKHYHVEGSCDYGQRCDYIHEIAESIGNVTSRDFKYIPVHHSRLDVFTKLAKEEEGQTFESTPPVLDLCAKWDLKLPSSVFKVN